MKNAIFFIGTCLFLTGCGTDTPEPLVINDGIPEKVTLLFPLENSECNEGTDVTATESTVLFEWKPAANAGAYELVVINLESDDVNLFPTTETLLPVVLQRATPYAWYVLARSFDVDSVVSSNVWKFYNAGDGIRSYAPFPADIISPRMASLVDAPSGVVALEWAGGDIDNDIVGYDVKFGTTDPPPIFREDVTEGVITGVNVESGTIYYWSVTTHDGAGNVTSTGVFQFKVR